MKKNIVIMIVLVLVVSTLAAGKMNAEALKVGDAAPTFYLKDIRNNDVFLRNYCGSKLRQPWKNKEKYVVVLSFWATWCAPCQKEIPVLHEIANEFAAQKIKFFLVDVGEKKEKVAPFVANKSFKLPVLLDIYSMVSTKKYMVSALPSLFVIDQDGVIRYQTEGFRGAQQLRKELKPILEQLTVK